MDISQNHGKTHGKTPHSKKIADEQSGFFRPNDGIDVFLFCFTGVSQRSHLAGSSVLGFERPAPRGHWRSDTLTSMIFWHLMSTKILMGCSITNHLFWGYLTILAGLIRYLGLISWFNYFTIYSDRYVNLTIIFC